MAVTDGCFNATCEDKTTINLSCEHNFSVRYNNDLDIFFSEHRPQFSRVIKYVTIIWYILGITGNSLAFVVWIQKRMRNSSGFYLAALAMNDLLFLPLKLIFELQLVWNLGVLNRPILCASFPIPYMAFQHLSILLVLGFTVERYISICHPFQREKFCSTSRAVKVIISLLVFSLLMNVIHGYFWKFIEICTLRKEALTSGLWVTWAWITELTIFGIVPLVILLINVFVIREARRISKNDEKRMPFSKTSSQRTSATTLMLLAVSFYLIVTTLPVTVCYAMASGFPLGNKCMTFNEIEKDPTWLRYLNFRIVNTTVQQFGMSHFALNFYIYLLTGTIFRRELKILFVRLFCPDKMSMFRESDYDDVRSSLRSTKTNGTLVHAV